MMTGLENALTKRAVWLVNAFGLVLIYFGFLIHVSGLAGVSGAARFFAFSGALLGALVSTAAALGSRRTTDMQNLGLFLWAGFLIVSATWLIALF
jgi:hypothetical protein